MISLSFVRGWSDASCGSLSRNDFDAAFLAFIDATIPPRVFDIDLLLTLWCESLAGSRATRGSSAGRTLDIPRRIGDVGDLLGLVEGLVDLPGRLEAGDEAQGGVGAGGCEDSAIANTSFNDGCTRLA